MEPAFPPVTVLICTYNRLDEILMTVEALSEFLYYPQLRWLVCDDSSPHGYIHKLRKEGLFRKLGVEVVSTNKNSGWGANVNNGLRAVKTNYIFFIEDDYVLDCPLDLRLGVALLETKPHIGMLRYRGTAGDIPVYHQFQADISAFVPLYQEGISPVRGKMTYLQFNAGSPTAYVYSHGAHLKHRRFHQFYGMYPEGRKLGETEEAFAIQVKGMMTAAPDTAPGICILPQWIPMWFDHIGVSHQHTTHDK